MQVAFPQEYGFEEVAVGGGTDAPARLGVTLGLEKLSLDNASETEKLMLCSTQPHDIIAQINQRKGRPHVSGW
jgi:hypothetical protein